MRRRIEVCALMFVAVCVATIGASWPVHAMTEAEAADELIAVLGTTLPCPYFAVAWLEPPTTIEHRCTTSIEGAVRLREALPGDRIGYIIDMQVARNRFTSAYGFSGKPTPTFTLAQFLAGVAVPEESRAKSSRHASPLMVYSRRSVQ